MSSTAWQDAITVAVREALGARLDGPRWTRLGGSSLNATWRLDAAAERFFVKTNRAARLGMLEAEADGLRELARAKALRVPMPITSGAAGAAGAAADLAFLVLEWLELVPGGRDAALGRALAQLHRVTAHAHGWHRDNTIGTTPQANPWTADWPVFVRDCRIAPQLALAATTGGRGKLQRDGERLLAAIPVLLAGHSAEPSLLHGDLWSGNAGRLVSGEPVAFDPAAYFGDREADVAMTELFGGFGADFHAAYREAWPLDAGYAMRRTLYNLYHVLNHCNLFGGGYCAQAEAMIGRLLSEVH